MCTPEDDSIQFFDLELLYNSAATSLTENTNLIEDVNQKFNLLEDTKQVSVENERIRAELLKTQRILEEKTKEYEQMQKWMEEKKKDYDQMKQQFIKLGQDFANLHFENKRNALDAITANTRLEKSIEDEKASTLKAIVSENKYNAENTLRKAAVSNAYQLTKSMDQLNSEKANLQIMYQSLKEVLKTEKRKVSRLTYKLKTYEADLFSMAGKLALTTDKKTRDRETKLQISKYTNKRFNANLENIDSESIDTGRGSSFSNYSPAYSINFSPLNMTENFEQKMMKDASTSTSNLLTNETSHLTKRSITSPSIVDGTNPLENISVNVISSKEYIKTRDTASSPISFVDEMKEKITTVDIASSPISFVDDMEEKITTVNTAISFVSSSQDIFKKKMEDLAFSSISGIRSPAASAIMNVLDCSPKSMDVANSPIYVADPSTRAPISPTWECTASPIEFSPLISANVTIPANEITDISRPLEPTVVPFKPAAVTIPVVQTLEMTRPLQSTDVVERSIEKTPQRNRSLVPNFGPRPTVKTPDLSMQLKPMAVENDKDLLTRSNDTNAVKIQSRPSWECTAIPIEFTPLKSADVSMPANEITDISRPLETTAVPFKPAAVKIPVVQTPEMTRLLQSTDVVERSIEKTPQRNRSLVPNFGPRPTVKTPDLSMQLKPMAVENDKDLLTRSNDTNAVDIQSRPSWECTAIPIEFTALKSADVTIPANEITDISRPLELTAMPFKPAAVTIPVVQTPEMTGLLQSTDIVERSINKTPQRNWSLDPTVGPRPTVKTPDLSMQLKPMAVAKDADLFTRPNDTNDVKIQSPTTKIPEMAKPIETTDYVNQEAKTRTSEHVVSLVNNNVSVITKTPDLNVLINAAYVRRSVIQTPSRSLKHADARRPLITTQPLDETKQNENIKIFSPQKSLKEIQAVSQDYDQERDDVEVGMILNKIRLDWNALSPMSITPDLDEECLSQYNSDVRNDETERQSLQNYRSQSSKESDSLFVITQDYKKLPIPQNIFNNLKHKIKKDNPSHIKKNKVLKPNSNSLIRRTSVHKENKRQSHKTMQLRKRMAPVKINDKNTNREKLTHTSRNEVTESQESIKKVNILKENQVDSIISKLPQRRRSERLKSNIPTAQSIKIFKELQSNTRKQPERWRSQTIKSPIHSPPQSKTQSVPQTRTKLQSSPMSISKEPQSNTRSPPERWRSERIKSPIHSPPQSKTKSVPQTKTKLQSSPMSISKEPQSNTCSPPEKRRSERIKFTISSPQSNTHNSPERRRSERIKSTTSSPPQSKTNSVPKNQTKVQSSPMSISEEPQSNPHNPPERRTSERIKFRISPVESETNSEPQNQTKLQSSPMSISKEPQSNIRNPPERRTSETIKLTKSPAQSETSSVPQNHTKLQLCPISILIEPLSYPYNPPERRTSERIESKISPAQSETNSVPQNQTALQSIPMTILKEPQSNPGNLPERRTSEKIKSTISPEQSETNSEPQNHKKLQLSLIDIMSNSKEPLLNTRRGCPSIISNPEYGRKRTICRLMIAQSDNKQSKCQKKLECDTNKLNSAEIYSEDKFTNSYSKPLKTRISRVKASVSSNTESVPNNNQPKNISDGKKTETINKDLGNTSTSKRAKLADEAETTKIIIKDFGYTSASKRAKLADDTSGFLIKPGQNMNKNNNTKMSITHASTNTKRNKKNLEVNVNFVTTYENNNLMTVSEIKQSQNEHGRYCADYNDISMFNTDNINLKIHTTKINKKGTYEYEWTHNLLDKMIFRYGSNRKYVNKTTIAINNTNEDKIAKEIEVAVSTCVNASSNPNKYFETLQIAVSVLRKNSISMLSGALSKYLKNSQRKAQFLPGNKNRNYRFKPTPTKYVISFMEIIDCLDKSGIKLWEIVLDSCRHILFNLDRNAMPTLDVVESLTHLFVHMCQFNGRRNAKSVIMFMMTAMYCANYRAIIIIKYCLDLVPEILPNTYETPKILDPIKPLFRTFIFLLHFYKCDDQFGKVQSVRYTLKRRYGYDPTQDNDTTILYMLKLAIIKLSDHYFEIAMLEYSILILAKRKGTKWCHANIVQKILLPIMKGEVYASEATFRFCITIITKLLKPYNKEMIVHSIEVVNLLMNIIEQPHPQELKDDILCGMMCLSMKTVTDRINIFLSNWNPSSISPKLEKALEKYIERKPLKYWRYVHQFIAEQ